MRLRFTKTFFKQGRGEINKVYFITINKSVVVQAQESVDLSLDNAIRKEYDVVQVFASLI